MEELGIKTLIVWNNDYNNDKDNTFKRCLNFIGELYV